MPTDRSVDMIARSQYKDHRTKQRILEAAEALFADRGFYGASLGQIARRVRIAKPTLLHHFPSKDALHAAILEGAFRQLNAELNATLEGPGDDAGKMVRLVGKYFELVSKNPNHVRLMVREQLDQPRRAREVAITYLAPLLDRLEHYVKGLQSRGLVAPVNVRLFLIHMAGAIVNFVVSWPSISPLLDRDGRQSADRVFETFRSQLFEITQKALFATEKPPLAYRGRRTSKMGGAHGSTQGS